MCFFEYSTLKRNLKLRSNARDESMVPLIEEEYNRLSDSEKTQMPQITLGELRRLETNAMDNVEYEDELYSEAHAEAGAHIYEEESLRQRVGLYNPEELECDHRVNDDVIDAYVELYKKCFGDDLENASE